MTRVGAVDLGTLDWIASVTDDGSTYRMRSAGVLTGVVSPPSNNVAADITCPAYPTVTASGTYAKESGIDISSTGYIHVYDANYSQESSTAAFKQAMSGVMLHYALATPTTTPIDPPLNLTYKAAAGGTERITHTDPTAAPTLVVTYGSTADGIRDRALACIAHIEGDTASANYGVGSYLIHAGQLCRVTTAIAAGESITIGTNVTATTVMAEVIALTQ